MRSEHALLILVFILLPAVLFAHDLGSIRGGVFDKETGDPVVGANVIIQKTVHGTVSDYNGEFEFRNIHQGVYTLVISYVGFKPVVLTLEVTRDNISQVTVELMADPVLMESYSVVARQPFSTASMSHIRNTDLALRPNKSSQDLLKLVPGLITAQHAGGGKAEQIFLRGFDCDHGTDINISVDGVPVNMVSHGHGQGYADLHFLIPELVESMDVYKGPYFAEYGNLATAGAVRFKTRDLLPHNLIKFEGGMFNTFRTTLLVQPGSGSAEQNGYFGLQYYSSDGPFESPMNLQRMNVFGKYFVNIGHNSRLTLTAGSFGSAWDASGQVPDRAIVQGYITRFGAIDDREGGHTSRSDLNVLFEQKDDNNNTLAIQVFATQYDFKLFSNFTFYLQDPEHGDMIEQRDHRMILGSQASYSRVTALEKVILKTTYGAGFRSDWITVGLYHSPDRMVMDEWSNAFINERNLSGWIIEELVFSPRFRLQLGLRGDYLTFDVDDQAGSALDPSNSGIPHASGYVQQGMVNPKLNIAWSPGSNLEVYLNSGSGFHSNDARNVVIGETIRDLEQNWEGEGLSPEQIDERLVSLNFNPEQKNTTTLPRAFGGEIGIRARLWNQLDFGFAAWHLYLEKEFVYVGDGGYTELSDPTRRNGIDLEARIRLNRWLWADADVCFSNGHITSLPEGENYIPLAPRITSSGGITMKDFHGLEASARYIYVDDRPANEVNTVIASGYFIAQVGLSYHMKKFTFSVTLKNLFDTAWNEAQFDTESRLPWESEPVSEIHFTPGDPRNVHAGVSYRF